MAAAHDRDKHDWLEDFSIVLTRQGVLSLRRDPDLELFTGSKTLASIWLATIACVAGSLGGLLPSGVLWSSFLYPVAWLAALAIISAAAWRVTNRGAGAAVAFLVGWCVFWGLLIGALSGWAAQLGSPGWAYGLAGGIGFLVGITHGNLEHADIRGHDGWFLIGAALAPAGACLATALSRADLIGAVGEWQRPALAGLIASGVFLGPAMALYLASWDNQRALLRLASLYLHNDAFIAEALPLLDRAIRLSPEDAALLDRRALAHALNGDMPAAEADWALHKQHARGSRAVDLSRGWLHLRRGQLDAATAGFDSAMGGKPTRRWATIGRALVHLRKGEPDAAINLLRDVAGAASEARTETYFAQAHLAAGNPAQAIELANVAIDEMDSVHGLSWLIRAEARIGLGNTDHAIADLNRALLADDEAGIEERALAWLEKIEGDVLDDAELEELERSLASV